MLEDKSVENLLPGVGWSKVRSKRRGQKVKIP
jgi:hypothetical protein